MGNLTHHPLADGPVRIAAHELERLINADRMLTHLLTHCTYLEDGTVDGTWWSANDLMRGHMSLHEYLTERVAGNVVPTTIESDDDNEICAACNGSGEGMYDGTRCGTCKGSGASA
jgi:hypothetical protein